jgi:hypothetical protein
VDWSVVGNRPSNRSTRVQTASRNDRRRAAVEQRREQARRLAQREAQRRRRLKIGIPLGVVALLLAGGGVFLLVARDGGGAKEFSLTSELAAIQAGDFAITTTPAAYHLVYRVDSFGGDDGQQTNTQEYTVRRPFDAYLVDKSGAPPGGDEQYSLLWNLGKYAQSSAGAADEVGQLAPQPALGDIRLDATLEDLVADGTFVPKERRLVLGRECQVYRTGQPLETFGLAAPTDDTYTDACVDSDGLLLEELSVSSGELVERLIATQVDDQIQPTDDTFAITGEPTTLDQGGSQLTAIDAATKPVEGYWGLDTPPSGYQLQGRYLLQTPSDAGAGTDTSTTTTTTAPVAPVPSYIDVYVNGVDTIMVRQGPTAAEPTSPTNQGASVDLGALGTTPLTATLTGSRLVAHPTAPADWYVEVTGTVSRTELQQAASALHA